MRLLKLEFTTAFMLKKFYQLSLIAPLLSDCLTEADAVPPWGAGHEGCQVF